MFPNYPSCILKAELAIGNCFAHLSSAIAHRLRMDAVQQSTSAVRLGCDSQKLINYGNLYRKLIKIKCKNVTL
jgi:hypothetical protein